jgi:SH3-like domain-containing protein
VKVRFSFSRVLIFVAFGVLLLSPGCKRGGGMAHREVAYVAAPQVNLRDRLSAIYNKVGTVKNGERVEILEKGKHFVRVRSPRGEEGWIETRYLVGAELFDALDLLARSNLNTPVQAHGVARNELKMHVTPGRDTDALFRVDDGAKLEILKRATAEKPQPKPEPAKPGSEQPAPPPPQLEDWWLVRDAPGHAGWVLARMVDIDIPLDIAQYAEGQRIMAAFVLSQVPDVNPENGQPRQMPQYLTLVNEPRDGTPWDFNQLRVFTWNSKRHHYETAYREHNLFGVFPVTVGHQVFDREGDLPTFTIRVKAEDGSIVEREYKLNQPIVRRVQSAGEQPRLAAAEPRKNAKHGAKHRH